MAASATEAVRAAVGTTVTYTDSVMGGEHTFTLVSAENGNPIEGALAVTSPVGQALEGLAVGESAQVDSPALRTRTLTVTAVERR